MTQEEAEQFYGKDASEWLRRWDSDEGVWSVEMGGLGPGYEQCIQITTAEILRHLIATGYDHAKWKDEAEWKAARDAIEKYGFANEVVKKLGLSGAQWGAAMNLATNFYMMGPAKALTDERVEDRKIQTRRRMPQAA